MCVWGCGIERELRRRKPLFSNVNERLPTPADNDDTGEKLNIMLVIKLCLQIQKIALRTLKELFGAGIEPTTHITLSNIYYANHKIPTVQYLLISANICEPTRLCQISGNCAERISDRSISWKCYNPKISSV